MSPLRKKKRPIAIMISDLHLSHSAPSFRSNEDDWYRAMSGVIDQINDFRTMHDSDRYLPLLIAGDVFDRWDPPPQLIEWCCREFQGTIYVVAGQHDLPNHSMDQIHRSALGVLLSAGIVQLATPDGTIVNEDLFVAGWSWREDLFVEDPAAWEEREEHLDGQIMVALTHRYCWTRGCDPIGNQQTDGMARKIGDQMMRCGFDLVHTGDNHIGFIALIQNNDDKVSTRIFNGGTVMRRSFAEIDYRPMIGVLMNDGSVHRKYLNIDNDAHLQRPAKMLKGEVEHVNQFIEGLRQTMDEISFKDTVRAALPHVAPGVQTIIKQAIGDDD